MKISGSTNDALTKAYPDSNLMAKALKSVLADASARLMKKSRLVGSSGFELTKKYTDVVDNLLDCIFNLLSKDNSSSVGLSLIAMGGYGRGELNLRSDIDLMLLYDRTITKEVEKFSQDMLYILWDAGLDVGFALRSIKECIKLAKTDVKTKTSLIDLRLISGNKEMYAKLGKEIEGKLFNGKGLKTFIDDKLEESSLRHEKFGGSVYTLEPNVKEGEGGLRDLHSLRWIVTALEGEYKPTEKGYLTQKEKSILDNAADFIITVRNELHHSSERKTDLLTFSEQMRIAEHLGYTEKDTILAVESFMQHYYRQAFELSRISALAISRCLHKNQYNEDVTNVRGRSLDEVFKISKGTLTIKDEPLFREDPTNIMRTFVHSQRYGVSISQAAIDLILVMLRSIDDAFRSSKKVSELFLTILRGDEVYPTLNEMHRLGVLQRYIPEFDEITCRMQHDLYHIYTVDVHTLFAIRNIDKLRSSYKERFPVLSKLLLIQENIEVLILAVLFHDIGKSRGKGHAEKGAVIALDVSRRLGLSEEESRKVEFLVRQHLILPNTAQYRDLHDEKLIMDFAKTVDNNENLDLLYLLTFADVKAVGPEVWSEWKGTLFQELYIKASRALGSGSFEPEDVLSRLETTRDKVTEILLGSVDAKEINSFFKLLPSRYYLRNSPEAIARHLTLMIGIGEKAHAMGVRQVEARGYTELVICCHDIHGLFAKITGVLAANSVNILGANINTLKNGMALDVLQVKNVYGKLITDEGKLSRIESDLTSVITDEVKIERLLKKKKPGILDSRQRPRVSTRVHIDNIASDQFTIIEVYTEDSIGLLYNVSSKLSELALFIHVAKITTMGSEVADIFYVKDIYGQKILYDERLKTIVETLKSTLDKKGDNGE